jgi:hypothetical protein
MFGFLRNKNDQRIRSIHDFIDPRARALAKKHNLSPDKIFLMYRDLDAEILATNGEVDIDPNMPQEETIKKLVCSSIICYELSSRESIRFEDDGKTATVRREAQPQVFDTLGRFYEDYANRLNYKN